MPINTSNTSVDNNSLRILMLIVYMIILILLAIIFILRKKIKKYKQTAVKNSPNNSSSLEQEGNESSNKNTGPKTEGLLIFLESIALVVVVVLAMINFGTCTYAVTTGELPQSCAILERDANNNDVTIDITENLNTFTIDFKVKPNTNIKNLQITCKFYDSSNKLVATKVKDLGNVTKGNQFTFSISLSVSEILRVSYTSADVTGGVAS